LEQLEEFFKVKPFESKLENLESGYSSHRVLTKVWKISLNKVQMQM